MLMGALKKVYFHVNSSEEAENKASVLLTPPTAGKVARALGPQDYVENDGYG